MALTLLELRVLGGCSLARTCSRESRLAALVLCAQGLHGGILTVSLRLSSVALWGGVLLLTEGLLLLLLAGALLILGLLLTVLGVT